MTNYSWKTPHTVSTGFTISCKVCSLFSLLHFLILWSCFQTCSSDTTLSYIFSSSHSFLLFIISASLHIRFFNVSCSIFIMVIILLSTFRTVLGVCILLLWVGHPTSMIAHCILLNFNLRTGWFPKC